MSHTAEIDVCQASGRTYNSEEVTCDRLAGHGGSHMDLWAGWEWLPDAALTRPIPPEVGDES